MGQLLAWDRSWSVTVEQARPIGSMPRQTQCTACRVARQSGQVVFKAEEPIAVQVQWRPFDEESSGGLWRLEAKAQESAASPVPTAPTARDELICAEFPRSNGWLARTPFRRGERHARDGVPFLAPNDGQAAISHLAQQKRDPWEQGKWLTAAVAEGPDQYLLLASPLRNFKENSYWLFGVCESYQALRDEVLQCPRGQELVQEALQGRMRIVAPRGRGRGAVRESRPVHRRAIEEAQQAWLAAVSQSFAGPAQSDAPPKASASASWLYQPLIELAERIFRSHLDNASRRYEREDRRLGPGDEHDF